MEELVNLRFISKKDEWFDENTEVKLICLTGTGRLNSPNGPRWASGLFKGHRNGGLDEEVCCFSEFDIVTEDYFGWPEAKGIKRVL